MYRVGYISGRYRHWKLENGVLVLDREAMAREVEDERRCMEVIARAGHAWIAPLHNSGPIEGIIPDAEFIARDLSVILRMREEWDFIYMREGWDVEPESDGAREEHDAATDEKLLMVHDCQGPGWVWDYLTVKLGGVTG